MFIQSTKCYLFRAKGEKDLKVPALFVGELPEWATKTLLFRLAVSDGSITYIGEPKKTGVGTLPPKRKSKKTDENA